MTARTGDVSAAEFNASQAAINELMQLVAKQDAELAALKGRRCDGCKWLVDASECAMPHSGHGPVVVAYDGEGYALLVDADHYCAAWESR